MKEKSYNDAPDMEKEFAGMPDDVLRSIRERLYSHAPLDLQRRYSLADRELKKRARGKAIESIRKFLSTPCSSKDLIKEIDNIIKKR